MRYNTEIRYNPKTTRFDVLIDLETVGEVGNYTDGDTLLRRELWRRRRRQAITQANREEQSLAGWGSTMYLTGIYPVESIVQVFRRRRRVLAGICRIRQRMLARRMAQRSIMRKGD